MRRRLPARPFSSIGTFLGLPGRVSALETLVAQSQAPENSTPSAGGTELVPNLGHSGILDAYVREAPSAELAIDIFKGEWSSILPAEVADSGGRAALFADSRIDWLLQQCGSVVDWSVLELGPLEGGHSYMLDRAGARITAIESNSRAYLKCLVVKEVLELSRCRFLFGDFNAYLSSVRPNSFDMVLASGVLYHATDPIGTLRNIANASNRIGLWTHVYDADVVGGDQTISRLFADGPVDVEVDGRTLHLHRRDYLEALDWSGFCGGPDDHSYWMEHADLLWLLGHLGFDDIEIAFDDLEHPNGPNLLLLASRNDPC